MVSPAPALTDPAFLAALLVAAAAIAVTVSFALFETDMWQHLAVGRAIATLRAIPTRQIWTWPTYGSPDVDPSWSFGLLVWTLWSRFGLAGLFAWRWASTLAAFGLLWAAARRMGARGLAPLVALVLCALVYRQRSQVRPETLVAVLLAAQLWIHEGRRAAARAGGAASDPIPWLVPIAWIWANAHITYWIGLLVQCVYMLDHGYRDAPARGLLVRLGLRGGRAPALVLAASIAISFANPWGWRTLWQPFDYVLHWRHEPIFATIGELLPPDWKFNRTNGLAVLLVGGALLMAWRTLRTGVDRAEIVLVPLFAALTFQSVRFIGPFALIAAPFVARNLDAWVRSRRWRWIPRSATARALLTGIACATIGIPEWTLSGWPIRVGLIETYRPEGACDFIAAHGVRGRGFNPFSAGGYLLFRFWPDRSRLPFMDIHQAGTTEDRYLSSRAEETPAAWQSLDRKYRFDYALLWTRQGAARRLIDWVAADTTTWALVFSDDAAALFLRRDGPLAAQADSFAYRYLPAGRAGMVSVMVLSLSDSAAHRGLEAELERAIAASPQNGRAKTLLASLALLDGEPERATLLAEDALRLDPTRPGAHTLLARVALASNRTRDALEHLRRETQAQGEQAALDAEMAACWARLGEAGRARALYRRALRLNPYDEATRESLKVLEAGPAR